MENKWKNQSFYNSLKNALNGIKYVLSDGRNVRIQICFAIVASVLGFVLKISLIEFLILILTIFFVLVSEFINTALENLADLYTTEYNEKVKNIKDIAAGTVTLAAVASIIVGIIIFLPKILNFI